MAEGKRSSPARLRRNSRRWKSGRLVKALGLLPITLQNELQKVFNCGCSHTNHHVYHPELVCDTTDATTKFVNDLECFMKESDLSCAAAYRTLTSSTGEPSRSRQRDLYPLPLLEDWPSSIGCLGLAGSACLTMTNICLCTLNFLHVGMSLHRQPCSTRASPTIAQKDTQLHVASRTVRFLERFKNADMGCEATQDFRFFEDKSKTQWAPLQADAVDLPNVAATCNPSSLVDKVLGDLIQDASSIFPHGCESGASRDFKDCDERRNYIRLTAKELECGKLRLRPNVWSSASVFAVGKVGKNRQRKIWNGSQISSHAAAPPRPPRLANPSCFLEIEGAGSAPLLFSKRDVATCFDIMQLPESLQPYMAQPPVSVDELVSATGWSLDTVRSYTDDFHGQDLRGASLYPVHVVWPMGFSWSSAIAQNCTMSRVLAAGVPEESVLSMDHATPACQRELAMIATDDVLLIHRSLEHGRRTLEKLDQELQDGGMPKNHPKMLTFRLRSQLLGAICVEYRRLWIQMPQSSFSWLLDG